MEANEFKRIFLPYHRLLYRVAFQLTGNATDGEDLMQELYYKLWQKRDSLGTEAQQVEYLVVMMRNIHLNQQRGKHDKLLDEMGENEIYDNEQLDSLLDSQEQRAVLYRLIDELPPKEAEIARLRIIEQKDYAEIQAQTGMEYGAVRSATMRARQKLTEKMKKIYGYERI